MSSVPDFSESEQQLINQTLKERYGKDVGQQVADVEIRLSVTDRTLTGCPAVFWSERDANFLVVESAEKSFVVSSTTAVMNNLVPAAKLTMNSVNAL